MTKNGDAGGADPLSVEWTEALINEGHPLHRLACQSSGLLLVTAVIRSAHVLFRLYPAEGKSIEEQIAEFLQEGTVTKLKRMKEWLDDEVVQGELSGLDHDTRIRRAVGASRQPRAEA
jgi:hypothetical protein